MGRKMSEPLAAPPDEPGERKEPPALPHDLPMFPENAPLDDEGEPIVRP